METQHKADFESQNAVYVSKKMDRKKRLASRNNSSCFILPR